MQTNEPDSREFPHFIRRQEGQAWMKFTIPSFSVRKVFQNKHTVHTEILLDCLLLYHIAGTTLAIETHNQTILLSFC